MINNRVNALRAEMKKNKIDCYIIPSFDAHQSEYVANHWKCREWISGFNGSAGTVVVTQDKAMLWTDGRYHVQATNQLEGSEYILMKQGLAGVPTIGEWIADNLANDACVGFDGKLFAYSSYKDFLVDFELRDFTIDVDHDLITPIWTDRPAIPQTEVMTFPVEYAGKSRTEKLAEIRTEMKRLGGASYLVPNLDDIAWIFNIRGKDISYCPFVISYAFITLEEVYLFVEDSKLPQGVKEELLADGIKLLAYEEIQDFLGKVDVATVLYSPVYTSVSLVKAFPAGVKHIAKGDIATRLKAVKNPVEIKNIRNSQIKDGVAMVKFHKWLNESIPQGIVDELVMAEKLREYRAEQDLNLGESFNTIAAYGPNAAMAHYSATPESFSKVEAKGLLLFDSGGQYMDGTTDITRTIAVGPVTDEEMTDYTLTLKAHIGLAKAQFLKGTCGPHLDILARRPMWEVGVDYKHGTGHGVGFLLSVHEGPFTVRCNQNDVPLEVGMYFSNEPGVYRPGKHGIRTENLVLVEKACETEHGEFYKLETITYCPIDTKPLKRSIMSEDEIKWLNDYHKVVFDKLAPHFDDEMKAYLKELTAEF
jgi:Xaa-Pro aminopeptidase